MCLDMGWLQRRQERFATAVAVAVAQAIDDRLASLSHNKPSEVIDASGKMLGAMTGFLTGASELALKGAASALGQRGGRKTQALKRKALQSAPRERPACPVCRDPNSRTLTVEQILEHRRHEHLGDEGRTEAPNQSADSAGAETANQLYGLQAVGFKGPIQ